MIHYKQLKPNLEEIPPCLKFVFMNSSRGFKLKIWYMKKEELIEATK